MLKPFWLKQVEQEQVARDAEAPDRPTGAEVLQQMPISPDRRDPVNHRVPGASSTFYTKWPADNDTPFELLQAREQELLNRIELEKDISPPDLLPRQEARRSSRRIRAPRDFYFFVSERQYIPLELTAILQGPRPRLMECFLFDVNDSGIGFACEGQLETGARLTVCGHHGEDPTPLVAAEVEIIDHRPFPADATAPEKFSPESLWVHGTRMDRRAIGDALRVGEREQISRSA